MIKTCQVCRAEFEDATTYRVKCLPCWKDGKRAEEAAELRSAEQRAYARGVTDGRQMERGSRTLTFDEEFIFELIRLCHPDRHPIERAPLANKVTAKLNGMRGK